ncbi:MAG: radical SAM protein [Mailhella sp.]|nr:radical SAM protein [Mailhella sp.]
MKYTGTAYRPPFEAWSVLLQATQGCSHNRCAFCTMYRDIPFRTESLEQIDSDLREAAALYPHRKRVFLLSGDAFALKADTLLAIVERVHARLPGVETISMYASVKNIRSKSDEELRALRGAGIDQPNIGLESGLDETLAAMRKGYDRAEAERQLGRLNGAGMDFSVNVILGGAGRENSLRHAEATASLLNEVEPYLIFTGTMHPEEGSPMHADMLAGRFGECTIGEYLDEEERFIEALDPFDCLYFGMHPSNVVQIRGYLSEDKESLLEGVRARRAQLAGHLSEKPKRGREGAFMV